MVKTRRLAREVAGQALYSLDLRGEWSEDSVESFFGYFFSDASLLTEDGAPPKELRDKQYRSFSIQLVHGVAKYRKELDVLISEAATRWNIERMLFVDRNILRLAVYEFLFCDEIPTNVSINEAIEVAKRLGTDDSPTFINGVLDRVARLIEEEPGKIQALFPGVNVGRVENL